VHARDHRHRQVGDGLHHLGTGAEQIAIIGNVGRGAHLAQVMPRAKRAASAGQHHASRRGIGRHNGQLGFQRREHLLRERVELRRAVEHQIEAPPIAMHEDEGFIEDHGILVAVRRHRLGILDRVVGDTGFCFV
jgi:hypothetical protein